MSQLSLDPGYQYIEDSLDLVGQKYRVQRIVRGAMLFLAGAIFSSIAAALLVNLLGQGKPAIGVIVAWIGWLLASAVFWIARPLMIRPKTVAVARLVESKITGLHNGLTNSILLANAKDISKNPWLPQIFAEVAATSKKTPLADAVKLGDLKPLGIRLGIASIPFLAGAILLWPQMAHGWQQMFSPTAFVPRVGDASILSIDPGDVTLVAGQPLEIGVTARAANAPDATLYFESASGTPLAPAVASSDATSGDTNSTAAAGPTIPPQATLSPTIQKEDSTIHYGYRAEHVDQSLRYRVDVGETQSPWYSVTVVKQVALTTLTLNIHPPIYTGQKSQRLVLSAADMRRRRSPFRRGVKSNCKPTSTRRPPAR